MLARFAALILVAAGTLVAGAALADELVDLTERGALQDLKASNPEHYERIVEIIEGLRQKPERAETGWLQVTFDAQNVDLSKLLLRTSNPPKQSLSFTLDDARYRLFVTRTDLVAEFMPAR